MLYWERSCLAIFLSESIRSYSASREAWFVVLPATFLGGTSADLFAIVVNVFSCKTWLVFATFLVLLYLLTPEFGIRAVHKICVTMFLKAHLYKPILVKLTLQVISAVRTWDVLVLVLCLVAKQISNLAPLSTSFLRWGACRRTWAALPLILILVIIFFLVQFATNSVLQLAL